MTGLVRDAAGRENPGRPRKCRVRPPSGFDVHDLRVVVADLVGELGNLRLVGRSQMFEGSCHAGTAVGR
jgi:hypothetical protein